MRTTGAPTDRLCCAFLGLSFSPHGVSDFGLFAQPLQPYRGQARHCTSVILSGVNPSFGRAKSKDPFAAQLCSVHAQAVDRVAVKSRLAGRHNEAHRFIAEKAAMKIPESPGDDICCEGFSPRGVPIPPLSGASFTVTKDNQSLLISRRYVSYALSPSTLHPVNREA